MNKISDLYEGISPVENRPTSLHLVNGDASDPPPAYAQTSDMDGRKKSVTFATNSPSPSGNSTASPISPNTPISSQGTVTGSSMNDTEYQPLTSTSQTGTNNGGTPPSTVTPPPSLNSSFNSNTPSRNLLGLTPSDEVAFDVNNNAGQNNVLHAKLQIRNTANKPVIFKIKTTSPEKYRVRPSASQLKIGGVCDVEIHVHQSQLNDESSEGTTTNSIIISSEVSASLIKDKFLVTAITLEEDTDEHLPQSKLNELLKNNRPEAQYRLRCSLSGNQIKVATTSRSGSGNAKEISPTSSTLASANKQLENLSKKVNELKQTVSESAETITSLKKTTLLLLGLIMFLQLVLTYQVMSLNPVNLDAEDTLINEDQLNVKVGQNVDGPEQEL